MKYTNILSKFPQIRFNLSEGINIYRTLGSAKADTTGINKST